MSAYIRAGDRLRVLVDQDSRPCVCRLDGRRVLGVCLVHWAALSTELRPLALDDLAFELGFERNFLPTRGR